MCCCGGGGRATHANCWSPLCPCSFTLHAVSGCLASHCFWWGPLLLGCGCVGGVHVLAVWLCGPNPLHRVCGSRAVSIVAVCPSGCGRTLFFSRSGLAVVWSGSACLPPCGCVHAATERTSPACRGAKQSARKKRPPLHPVLSSSVSLSVVAVAWFGQGAQGSACASTLLSLSRLWAELDSGALVRQTVVLLCFFWRASRPFAA